jgi:hypothetical protein
MKFSTIPGWKATRITRTADVVLVQVKLLTELLECPHCKCSKEMLVQRGLITQLVKDIPWRGKPVELSVRCRQYLCTACWNSSLQPMAGVHSSHSVTDRLIKQAAQWALRIPVEIVTWEMGVAESLMRLLIFEELERLKSMESREAPRILELQVIYVGKQENLLLTDPKGRNIISLTAGADHEAAIRALSKLRDTQRIEIVTLPLSRDLWNAVRRKLPQAKASIDRFRAMCLAGGVINVVRKQLRSLPLKLEDETAIMTTAYGLRVQFINIFRTDSSTVARQRYAEWVAQIPEELWYAFGPLVQIVDSWNEEIFCYFDHHFPNIGRRAASRTTGSARRDERRRGSQKNRSNQTGVTGIERH